jgi:hypothetical protein
MSTRPANGKVPASAVIRISSASVRALAGTDVAPWPNRVGSSASPAMVVTQEVAVARAMAEVNGEGASTFSASAAPEPRIMSVCASSNGGGPPAGSITSLPASCPHTWAVDKASGPPPALSNASPPSVP